MDDGFEILIYILFIVVSLLGGLYKNYTKRKEEEARKLKRQEAEGKYSERNQGSVATYQKEFKETQPPPPTKPNPNPFEEFLRQQLENFEEPEPDSPPREEIVKPETRKEAILDDVGAEGSAVFKSTTDELLSDNMKEENFTITNSMESREEEGEVYSYNYNKIEEDEISDDKSIIEEFDGRKAIIFSEILKRPDF